MYIYHIHLKKKDLNIIKDFGSGWEGGQGRNSKPPICYQDDRTAVLATRTAGAGEFRLVNLLLLVTGGLTSLPGSQRGLPGVGDSQVASETRVIVST